MASWVQKKPERYSIEYEGWTIHYDYRADDEKEWLEGYDHAHFEFRGKAISDTGYYSHFVNMKLVEVYGGREAYAREFVKVKFRPQVRQTSLFE